jgi:tetratricopeptide (TPR) repeat protein
VAQARLGNFAGAERSIAPTPGDCYPCLIARAGIAEAQHQRERADWWFARAEEAAPSFAFAPAEWGVALLARGQTDEAIEKFKTANQKSPHFADPLEMWGEALMAKKQPDQALAKFPEAEKYAPNWGRLHLKWGEALTSAGKKDEAQKQFTLAATLDLSAADKAELARVSHG